MKIYNKLKEGKIRTRFDLNEIIENDNYAELILYKEDKEFKRVIIDIEDINKVKNFKWHLDNRGYTKNEKNKILLHRLIMNAKDGEYVDHINHNTLDNRKENLRVVTNQQNGMNRKLGIDNTSGVTGVSFNKRNNKWISQIGYNGKLKYLGYFDNLDDAIKVRKKAERKYFGEFRIKEELSI
ncbi:HNH endonuclease [Clostridium perfringens]|uniref:HNH endonuclease n=1 Tax=Clostridium perfringens TaxID=1502 RepID=UPI0023406007|nr:HNH endonuclease [Clostridium perfringens]MDC4245583.1 HNH endonuclease [Clostridium perfringens]